jgi:hypothetical protein
MEDGESERGSSTLIARIIPEKVAATSVKFATAPVNKHK